MTDEKRDNRPREYDFTDVTEDHGRVKWRCTGLTHYGFERLTHGVVELSPVTECWVCLDDKMTAGDAVYVCRNPETKKTVMVFDGCVQAEWETASAHTALYQVCVKPETIPRIGE